MQSLTIAQCERLVRRLGSPHTFITQLATATARACCYPSITRGVIQPFRHVLFLSPCGGGKSQDTRAFPSQGHGAHPPSPAAVASGGAGAQHDVTSNGGYRQFHRFNQDPRDNL